MSISRDFCRGSAGKAACASEPVDHRDALDVIVGHLHLMGRLTNGYSEIMIPVV
jgi:hypothetical protein